MSLVFITGSGRRIGRALAIRFAKKGWNVAVNYNSSKYEADKAVEAIRSIGVNCDAFKADVSNIEELEMAFSDCRDTLGVPDVLINNAGVFPKQHSIDDTDEELWDFVQNVNTKGQFNAIKTFVKFAKHGGKIVNIASLGAFQTWKGRIPYHVSKAGVYKLTKVMASELAPNFTVNSVSPGIITVKDEPAADSSGVAVEKIPMKRYGNEDDIFDAVYFFSTASNFITGQNINVDGGYHLDI